MVNYRSSRHGAVETNLTSNHEVAGSFPLSHIGNSTSNLFKKDLQYHFLHPSPGQTKGKPLSSKLKALGLGIILPWHPTYLP